MMRIKFNLFALLLIGVLSVSQIKAADINGRVLYQGDTARPLNNVIVSLRNLDNNSLQTFTTTANGMYSFTNLANGNYSLTGTTSINGGGVSYYDAVMVFLNIIGFYQFTPIQSLASDVNGNGIINWTDYNLIVSHILYGTAFPVGPWKFETTTFSISNFKDGVPTGVGGTCSGDVGGTFVPVNNNTPALPVAQEGSVNVTANEEFTTRIITKNSITTSAAGIVINYPTELLNITSVEFKGNDFEYNITDGQIRMVWGNPNTEPIQFEAGETLVTLHGTTTSAFGAGMSATFSVDGNTSIMNSGNEEIADLKMASPVIKYTSPSLNLTNFPNPVVSSTRLSFFAPEAGEVTISVYSMSGQLIKSITEGTIDAGNHELILDATDLSKGYYICKLSLSTGGAELSSQIKILKAF